METSSHGLFSANFPAGHHMIARTIVTNRSYEIGAPVARALDAREVIGLHVPK